MLEPFAKIFKNPKTRGTVNIWFGLGLALLWVFFYFWVAFAAVATEFFESIGAQNKNFEFWNTLTVKLPQQFVDNWHFLYLPMFALVDHSIEVIRDVRIGVISKKNRALKLWIIFLLFALFAVFVSSAVEDLTIKQGFIKPIVVVATLLTVFFKAVSYQGPGGEKVEAIRFSPKKTV